MNPCPCGKPWPDLNLYDPAVRAFVEMQVANLGLYVTMKVGRRTFKVSRYCIAYHGITGAQLLSGTSGYTEETDKT